VACDDLSFHLDPGSVTVLLGPNGAGKSTIMKSIIGFLRYEGKITVGGLPNKSLDARRMLGYIPEIPALYPNLTVSEHMEFLARAYRLKDYKGRVDDLFARFELEDKRRKFGDELSKGMQQKVQFIGTVIHRPPLLIFDEPFSGFDPVNAEQLKVEILALRDQGSTILFSTHNMASVEEVCQQITLLNHAHVVLTGSVDEVKQQHKKNIIAVQTPDTIEPNDALFTLLPPDPVVRDTRIMLAKGVLVRDAIAWLNDHYLLTGFTEVLPSMNEIFIETVKSQSNTLQSNE
jgi:ABC-2 type transport system ATP-binding protein